MPILEFQRPDKVTMIESDDKRQPALTAMVDFFARF